MMRSIGMDVHRSFAQVAIFDDGAIVANFRVDIFIDGGLIWGRRHSEVMRGGGAWSQLFE
jgi:transposase